MGGSIPVICKPNFVLMLINIYIPLCLFPFSFFFPFFVEKRKKKSKKKKSEKTKKRGEQLTVVIVRKTSFLSFFRKKVKKARGFIYFFTHLDTMPITLSPQGSVES